MQRNKCVARVTPPFNEGDGIAGSDELDTHRLKGDEVAGLARHRGRQLCILWAKTRLKDAAAGRGRRDGCGGRVGQTRMIPIIGASAERQRSMRWPVRFFVTFTIVGWFGARSGLPSVESRADDRELGGATGVGEKPIITNGAQAFRQLVEEEAADEPSLRRASSSWMCRGSRRRDAQIGSIMWVCR
jgi:hypothetical protein